MGRRDRQFVGILHGPHRLKSYNPIGGLAISGGTAYYGNGYAEAGSTSGKFSTANPNSTKELILKKGADVWHVATDGNVVYWSGADPNAKEHTFVFGTRVADDTQIAFPSGVPYTVKYGFAHSHVIDKRTDGSQVSGLAVQKKGPLLFVSHADKNEIDVLNKTTGAPVRTIKDLTAPSALAVDGGDNLWLVCRTGPTFEVRQYAATPDGSLTPKQTLKAALDTPLALGVSPDNSTLVLVDGGASQQVKAFSAANGAPAWTFGVEGGCMKSPVVSDDRFLFEGHSFVAFQPDGSFWVGDYGNDRIQHYTAAREFINRVQYRRYSYSCAVDPNNPTRVFSDYLEYAVDYSKPLAPDNGSWVLVRNWTKVLPEGVGGNQYRRIYPCTLTNGRTYALLPRDATNDFQMYELTAAGRFRETGITASAHSGLQPDGSICSVDIPKLDGKVTWTRAAIAGFDANANPAYTEPSVLASAPARGMDPVWWGDATHLRPGVQTSSGVVISFSHHVPDDTGRHSFGYHLGGVKVGGSDWLWRTSRSTHKNYFGPWPEDGSFDLGNGVKNAGSVPMALDRHVFYGYYGEFYRGGQVNKYRHYFDDGLLVGEFGEVGAEIGNSEGGLACAAKMAGNAINPWIIKLPDGRAYLYHNDESWHGGVHRWRLDGLSTVAEQSIPVELKAPAIPGLFGEYFDTPDLNSATRTTLRTDEGLESAWGSTIPAGVALSSPDDWSARWSGFVVPTHTGKHTFHVAGDGTARLWVDGKLIVDGAVASGGGAKGEIALTAGRFTTIRLEYSHGSGSAGLQLAWECDGLPREVVPKSQFRWAPWLETRPTPGQFDLLAGPTIDSQVANHRYGFTRDGGEDTTSDYWDRWIVRTSKFTYAGARNVPNDLSVFFNNNTAATRTLSRDLGAPSDATTQWTLAASINYSRNAPNAGVAGGQYLEILDDAGKVIARFFPQQIKWPDDLRVTANSVDLLKGNKELLVGTMDQWQPLSITGSSKGISFAYAGSGPAMSPVFDSTANWKRPKTLRLQFFSTSAAAGAAARSIALRSATFSRMPVAPVR